MGRDLLADQRRAGRVDRGDDLDVGVAGGGDHRPAHPSGRAEHADLDPRGRSSPETIISAAGQQVLAELVGEPPPRPGRSAAAARY